MLSAFAKLLKILNSEAEPGQISLAMSFSLVAGLTPFVSLHNLLVLLLVLLLRVSLSAFIVGLAFFSAAAYLLDPLFHWIGLKVLALPVLESLWTGLYQSSLWRLERFNNTVLMGSLLFSLVFFFPVHLLIRSAILRYREHLLAWVRKSRLMQALKASKFYRLYASYRQIRGLE